jgi:hypothetical protein
MPAVCSIFWSHEYYCEIAQSPLVDEVECGRDCACDECLFVAFQVSIAGNVGNVVSQRRAR